VWKVEFIHLGTLRRVGQYADEEEAAAAADDARAALGLPRKNEYLLSMGREFVQSLTGGSIYSGVRWCNFRGQSEKKWLAKITVDGAQMYVLLRVLR